MTILSTVGEIEGKGLLIERMSAPGSSPMYLPSFSPISILLIVVLCNFLNTRAD